MKTNPHILLTGASGTVGREVLKQLYEQRHDLKITVFDLQTKKSLQIFSPYKKEVDIVYGDISNFRDIQKACVDIDFVIHLAAIIPPLADENPDLANRINISGTENLVRNLEQLSPSAFFIFSSSISVYGDRLKNPLIKVGDPLIPSENDEYAKTKIKAEQIISNSTLDWSIFRLTAIMGMHKISKIMFHMPLETSMEIATPEDTARAFVRAIEKRILLSKKTFNLGGGKDCRTSYKEFLTRSFRLSGLGKFNFPEKAFAEKNFHCGFYDDGDDLENILHFRNDSLERYFSNEKSKISIWRKSITSALKAHIKGYLLKQSEPYQAFINKNTEIANHYFRTN